jgi:hypothetical protein
MDLKIVEWEGVKWIDLAEDRDKCLATVNVVMNLRVPYNAWNILTSLGTVSFSRELCVL